MTDRAAFASGENAMPPAVGRERGHRHDHERSSVDTAATRSSSAPFPATMGLPLAAHNGVPGS
jgi:hypothetical protein